MHNVFKTIIFLITTAVFIVLMLGAGAYFSLHYPISNVEQSTNVTIWILGVAGLLQVIIRALDTIAFGIAWLVQKYRFRRMT